MNCINTLLKHLSMGVILFFLFSLFEGKAFATPISASSTLSHKGGTDSLKVIPSVDKWEPSQGYYGIKHLDVSYAQGNDSIRELAHVFHEEIARDLKLTSKLRGAVGTGGKHTGTPGIFLNIDADIPKPEAYRIRITSKNILLSGHDYRGLVWATRTLLQMMAQYGYGLPQGAIEDSPSYPNRGFMIDVARKFFTIEDLRDYIKQLSYYKMNELQVHLNDNGFPEYFGNDWNKTYSAFRLQSDYFPGLAAKDGHYTKQEFRDLQKMGRIYGVNVIPEIDIPAHSLAFAHYRPELGSKKYGEDHLDLDNPHVYTFCDSLLREYISGDNPVFINDDVHIGTDEYDARESEKYRAFTDRYLRFVQSLGKTARMWGGLRWLKGKTPVQAQDVVMNAWSYDWVDPHLSVQDGYKLLNSCDTWLYIVPATGYYRDTLDTKWLYDKWTPLMMNRKETLSDSEKHALLGTMFAVWNDHCGNGISAQDVHWRVYPAIKVMAEQTWSVDHTERSKDYNAFRHSMDILHEAPGVDMVGRWSDKELQAFNRSVKGKSYTLTGNNTYSMHAPHNSAGFDYEVEFSWLDKGSRPGTVLFGNRYTEILVNIEGTGCIGFTRDGYTYKFNYKVDNRRHHYKITGTSAKTCLWVDGRSVDTLSAVPIESSINKHGRKTHMYYQQTLFFPTQTVGHPTRSAKGRLSDISIKQISH
ncbi:glycoside hydrolase family 20 protein [Porphyromonas pogonae]|uniref:beta-N-acetylhexosaminidase n=1 Tax=Porphyromonas pogonae TaxID=867595 RepID=UPI002E7620DA|nr:glycoside hydrolase family 20 protein [Porphyromonas pogonae]